ncbi:anthranilate synthase component I [Alkalihalobacillus sp. AL-G]|uniref:anthranilate synthase component I n=1 Tax=Alkalihalobacillus sp. AL-G TaxID=2926399 RepID=UPI00272CFB68|nr:anthranilate synthase component I [Alkalihalobacillus sp. AL-G]WLD94723.1 anthranilate synthase component I [Alkalihalobacillus sp. AL-G]
MSILTQVRERVDTTSYTTCGGIYVSRQNKELRYETATDGILKEIDYRKGALFSSRYQYPGRYSRWDVGFYNPMVELRSQGRKFEFDALNERGGLLLTLLYDKLEGLSEISSLTLEGNTIKGQVVSDHRVYEEEMRSKLPSIFTVIRAVKSLFESEQDAFLGLYGAFGYDLVFQFEPIPLKRDRTQDSNDLVLFIPDELVVVDHELQAAHLLSYEFVIPSTGKTTEGLERCGRYQKPNLTMEKPPQTFQAGSYAHKVNLAKGAFKKGDLFEVVPSHSIFEKCEEFPSEVFTTLQNINPSPYGFVINLGNEFLVGSSPEMYVRTEGSRVETCPISGTIKRGRNAIEDAEQIRTLLNSAKDEDELTMCTDVDRNDKSRICRPGSVKVIGRRQIELYSHLIHTVDHVEGLLRPEFDALDAFLTHMWAVTITGAPKKAAIRWIEEQEASPRGWYGGAVGWFSFNGDLNTGLTLRTMKIKNGVAEIRVGATLLNDSIPEAEEQETLTKAAALVQSVRKSTIQKDSRVQVYRAGVGKKVLLVDHEDSFVHSLADFLRQTGAEVKTLRADLARKVLGQNCSFDLVVLSPGPGKPEDFRLTQTIDMCLENELPIFGVCLGFQGIVEYFGGSLNVLAIPQHGKPTTVHVEKSNSVWRKLPESFKASLYHSLFAETIPECLELIGISEQKVPMAIKHKELPILGLQFHPESILTNINEIGLEIINNVVDQVTSRTTIQT